MVFFLVSPVILIPPTFYNIMKDDYFFFFFPTLLEMSKSVPFDSVVYFEIFLLNKNSGRGFLLVNRLTTMTCSILTVNREIILNQNFWKQIKKLGSSKNTDLKKYKYILIHNPNFRTIRSP